MYLQVNKDSLIEPVYQIEKFVSMSNMKYDALIGQGIKINQRVPIPDELIRMVKNKELGKKTGVGFYDWSIKGPNKPTASASETASIPENAEDRLILPMLNEAVACLEEDIVENSEMLDIGVIFGTGFAPFRGGPIQYAKDRGLENILAALKELELQHGLRFKAHPGWQKLLKL